LKIFNFISAQSHLQNFLSAENFCEWKLWAFILEHVYGLKITADQHHSDWSHFGYRDEIDFLDSVDLTSKIVWR
jgi:hypothetical protein